EEGLRTLGARDPGHLELPRGRQSVPAAQFAQFAQVGAASSAPVAALPAPTTPARLKHLAGSGTPAVEHDVPASSPPTPPTRHIDPVPVPLVAQVAPVARVAQVATVARVAQVATVAGAGAGAGAPVDPPATRAPSRQVATADVSTAASAGGDLAAARHLVRSVLRRRAADEGGAAEGSRDETSTRLDALAHALGGRGPRGGDDAAPLAPLARALGAGQLDRVDRVLAAQEAARARPLHELALAVEGERGGIDRITVGVSGRTVGATIAPADAESAARLGGRLDELTRALERAGLEPEGVRVTAPDARDHVRDTVGRAAQVIEAGRGAGAGAHDRQQDSTSRERETWRQEERRQQQGERQRPRRDQQETEE
ncbi:MAG TPA: hypothetical protein VEA99_01765, partial [Gemmatimonadaceae bacterium]|nr:hypothetical protein [Gemmatimonadaceae bacterium]